MQTKWVTTTAFLLLASALSARPGLTLTGEVSDSAGHPLPGATVMVYHAGVLNGYSTFCPSCYKDCGKRAKTGASGAYTINNVEPGLWFDLLIVRDGYSPEIIKVRDVSAGTTPKATLKARQSPPSPSHVAKGHVVDSSGHSVRDAVVTAEAIEIEEGSMVGTIPGLDPLAVTNEDGNFELVYQKAAKRILVSVEARTWALKFATLVTGSQRNTIELSRGATVRGRLVQDGKPVADAEIGLVGEEQGGIGAALSIVGNRYPEMRIGTQEDGSFVISDVPVGFQWLVYPKMESVPKTGTAEATACMTTRPVQMVDVGPIQLHPGHRLQGKVVLSDGKGLPDGMRIIIISQRVRDSQTAVLDQDGRFEFLGLSQGEYSIAPSVRGYRLPDNQPDLQLSVQRSLNDFVIRLNPEVPQH